MTIKKICKECEHFPEEKNYAFCSNATESGRMEVMSYYPACDKFRRGDHKPCFG